MRKSLMFMLVALLMLAPVAADGPDKWEWPTKTPATFEESKPDVVYHLPPVSTKPG